VTVPPPLLPLAACRVFVDGTLSDPQLDHPECVAVHRDGSVWCGGERGQVYRIEPDGSAFEEVASTGGFCLGLTFGPDETLYVCDVKRAAVVCVDTASGAVRTFADGAGGRRLRNPNYAAFDSAGRLYVSDSNAMHEPGPGIYRFDPDGRGELWFAAAVDFANGIALDEDAGFLYVAESFGSRVFRIPIRDDGTAGAREDVLELPECIPDGLAFGPDRELYVACYEPSQILVSRPPYATAACLVRDVEAHLLCHPTNVALRGRTLFAANLGRWHVTTLELP
jgi:sugar lactone lactonase YvrE